MKSFRYWLDISIPAFLFSSLIFVLCLGFLQCNSNKIEAQNDWSETDPNAVSYVKGPVKPIWIKKPMFKYRARLSDMLLLDEAGHETIDSFLTVRPDGPNHFVVAAGHDILPEDDLELGDKISLDRAVEFFRKDIDKAIKIANEVVPNLDEHPEDAQIIVVALSFQLGKKGLQSFHHMLASIKERDYVTASRHLLDSKLAREQTHQRAMRESLLLSGAK